MNIAVDARALEPERRPGAPGPARPPSPAHVIRDDAEALAAAHRLAADFRAATVVTLFLFPEMNLRLRPRLRGELAPGTRIVSHRFDLGDWPPERRIEVRGHALFLWTVPPR